MQKLGSFGNSLWHHQTPDNNVLVNRWRGRTTCRMETSPKPLALVVFYAKLPVPVNDMSFFDQPALAGFQQAVKPLKCQTKLL